MQLWAHGLLQERTVFYVRWSAQLLKPYIKKTVPDRAVGLETGLETNFCGLGLGLGLGLGCFVPVLVLVSNRCGLGLVAQKLVSRPGNFCK